VTKVMALNLAAFPQAWLRASGHKSFTLVHWTPDRVLRCGALSASQSGFYPSILDNWPEHTPCGGVSCEPRSL